jgi:hypothetical protein
MGGIGTTAHEFRGNVLPMRVAPQLLVSRAFIGPLDQILCLEHLWHHDYT